MILVGHVTKDGTLAGPRVLEHAVDCVLQFEGEPQRTYRTLRALKNRFGSTNEIGVFEMRSGGLTEVADPSERFVRRGRARGRAPACCARWRARGRCSSRSRRSSRPSDVVPPRRVANGVDRNRLSLVLAVLARNGGPSLGSSDVFVSVAGGVRIEEPGADLAVALALASRRARRAARAAEPSPLACFGEVGLTGELRYVAHAERRLQEAARFGLEQVIVPARCLSDDAPARVRARGAAAARRPRRRLDGSRRAHAALTRAA